MAMEEPRTFEAFWPYYVGQHAHPTTRLLHFLGTSLAFSFIGLAMIMRSPLWLALAPIAGYGFSWLGHFGVEGNRPAAFRRPLWSFFGDMRMWKKIAMGQMDAELVRLGILSPE
jgi:hypothetical protein